MTGKKNFVIFAAMKKYVIRFLPFVFCILLNACGKCVTDDNACNTPIADYLYGVEYDDYDFEACVQYFNGQYIPSDAGCSEVRKGNFVGRNLDWYINRNASALIKVNHTDDHYASIGVVGCFPQFSNDLAKSGKYDDVYKYLPFKTEDGVNECGLYVGINVMPTGETSFDVSSWETGRYGHGAHGTNPSSSKTYSVNYLPRVLLDKASSVEEAKKLIASINWTEPVNYPHDGETQSFHWLICDAGHSVVLEFMDNVPVYTETDIVDEPSYATIMTNFTNALMKAGVMQTTGAGYERWDILHDYYDCFDESFDGMENLMKLVWYSHTYTIQTGSRYMWLTEFSSPGLPAEKLYKNTEIINIKEFREAYQDLQKQWKDRSNWYNDATSLWFTTHTSIYDLSSRTLHLLIHEGDGGMTEFYEAGLNDIHFAKPLK